MCWKKTKVSGNTESRNTRKRRSFQAEPPDAGWLERTCPLRLLLAEQPAEEADQSALEAIGLRLAAPTGEPFPPRPEPGGWHLMLEPLIVTGHFDDPEAGACAAAERERCRATFVVTEVDGLVH